MKQKRAAASAATARWRLWPSFLTIAGTLCVVALILYGVWWLNQQAQHQLAQRQRYNISFGDIVCQVPPGMTRETFLAEVRYLSDASATISLFDPELDAKLRTIFALHPWVESVEGVSVEPPRQLSVSLRFRTPVLAVGTDDGLRLVDRHGIVLPRVAIPDRVPQFLTEVAPPGPVGTPWPDTRVPRAAQLAIEYKPKTIEHRPQGWELILWDGRKLLVGG
ncbi:MAG: hypothetical protein RMJ56_03595 [Gemmataceae bacterium]|nr:hypothetical protein [Gemmataceae bacterium]